MAASLTLLLSLLVPGVLSAQELASEHVLPNLTGCVSNDMETFRCSWNVGTFQNLSQPGDLRLFYVKNVQSLTECPQYGPPGTSECYFSENHTSIWTSYSVQLYSRDRAVLYDQDTFSIEEIVQPDPPVDLNWTLLTVAMSGAYFDVRLSWNAPQTADVKTGWMRLQYAVEHREAGAGTWQSKDLQRNTVTSLYGLQTNVDHEVRVRSKMLSAKRFGAFSDSLFIRVASKVSRFPIAILLIFAALCFIGVLMLVMQQRLMVILLPPVPGPKIRGIDPELLKNGKLSELMSALGVHADQKSNNNNDQSDPWVEFIDLDMEMEEEEGGGSPSSSRTPLSSPGTRDDSDSGRDSCCCDGPSHHGHSSSSSSSSSSSPPSSSSSSCEPLGPHGPVQDPCAWAPREPGAPQLRTAVGPPPSGDDLYTQVSHVQRSGEVLLAPGEEEEEEEQREEEEEEEEKKKKRGENPKIDFRLVMMADATEAWGYSSERDAGKTSAGEPGVAPSAPPPRGDYGGCPPGGYTAPPPLSYTLVEGVDKQNSLLLRPNDTPAAWLRTPKSVPTPEGYLTPDLLRDITP